MPLNKKKAGAGEGLSFFLGLLLVGALLQAAGNAKGDSLVFPGVATILAAFFRLLAQVHTYVLIGTTLRHLVFSLLIATFFGVGLGLLEGAFPFFRRLLKPLMTMLRSIPMVVLVVVIMVLTRYSRVPYIASVLILLPFNSEAACEGWQSLDPSLMDVYRLNGSMSLFVLVHVHLPLMAGYLRQAYINAVGMGIKLVVSCEYLVQTRDSLGKAVNTSIYFNEYQDIYAYALIMILLVCLLCELPLAVLRRFR